MVSKELQDYIHESLKYGLSSTEVREKLRTAGWHEEDIEQALNDVDGGSNSRKIDVDGSRWVHWCAYSVLVLVIVILSASLFYLWKDRIDLSQTNQVKVKEFFTQLVQAEIGFTETGSMVFPDELQFRTERDTYIQDKKSFVVADLRAMQLTIYDDGVATRTVPILTKGKEGSWWETPTGSYTVLGRWPTAFSSIGNVWMPYSIQFYGNYLIHGWPHYADGSPVPQGYSGGCIRLATEDARMVFNNVDVGTPVLVLEDSLKQNFGVLTLEATDTVLPSVSAESFLIVDLSTGETILEKNSEKKLAIASLTKLMTAIVAHETIYLGRSIKVGTQMIASASQAFNPVIGSQYIGLDLLYPLLVQSSNDTAQVLARSVGEEIFVNNMNTKASSLEMRDTVFADASGISSNNVSTTIDLAKLLSYIYYKRPFIFDITKGITFDNIGLIKLGDTVKIADLENYNEFFDETDLIGIKNGQTTVARQTMASVWRLHSDEGGVPVAIIVLGSEDRKGDTEALLKWVKDNYVVRRY